jgi:hypothetical protein
MSELIQLHDLYFCWELPINDFYLALMWHPCWDYESYSPKLDQNDRELSRRNTFSNPAKTTPYPSWSWAGGKASRPLY